MSNLIKVIVDLETRRALERLAASNAVSVDDLARSFIQAGLKKESNVIKVAKARAWRRVDRVILDAATAARAKTLGERGEILAEIILENAGFSNVKNLNKDISNHPYADLYAEQGTTKYFISVKARNKYEADGIKENSGYKISPKERLQAKALEDKGIPAVIAVTFDAKKATYSCYFALLSELEGRHGIKMTPQARQKYTCFAEDAPCPWDMSHLLNTPNRRR
jgi:hypothetical protein